MHMHTFSALPCWSLRQINIQKTHVHTLIFFDLIVYCARRTTKSPGGHLQLAAFGHLAPVSLSCWEPAQGINLLCYFVLHCILQPYQNNNNNTKQQQQKANKQTNYKTTTTTCKCIYSLYHVPCCSLRLTSIQKALEDICNMLPSGIFGVFTLL